MKLTIFCKNLFIILCVVVILLTFIFAFAFKQNIGYAESNSEADVFAKIDAYLSEATRKAHFPATSITIVDKENVLFSKTYGDCASTDTPFLLGSVSKSFTALCVMQLVEKGKIDLDEKIEKYLPNATDGGKITIRQLLNHTSGLGEHQNLENYRIVGKQGVHCYANVNYSLLGKIIESVSNQSYESYVTENIFNPLKMTHSSATLSESKEKGLIEGHENWFGWSVKTNPKYPKDDSAWISISAGYISSSTADLGKYLQMYLNGGEEIISSESIEKMFYENIKVDADIPYSYGMGWTLINEPLKEPALRHSGLVETGMSTIYILPEQGIGIAFASNTNDYFVGKDLMDRIDWSVALLLMGDEPNQIGENEFVTRHLLYDLAYLVVFAISILPLCFINIFKKRLTNGKLSLKITGVVFLHLLLPIFILLLSEIFFQTPLWVVCAFVPDMFLATIISSTLLFAGGIIKTILLISKRKRKSAL